MNEDLERMDKKSVAFELNDRTSVCVNNIQVRIYVVYVYIPVIG